jgi:hypothetical protein
MGIASPFVAVRVVGTRNSIILELTIQQGGADVEQQLRAKARPAHCRFLDIRWLRLPPSDIHHSQLNGNAKALNAPVRK